MNKRNNVHYVRGTILLLLLGAPCLVAGLVCAVALIQTFVAGWLPETWLSDSAVDYLYGGSQGEAGRYFRAMISGVISLGTASVIRWGYTGKTVVV